MREPEESRAEQAVRAVLPSPVAESARTVWSGLCNGAGAPQLWARQSPPTAASAWGVSSGNGGNCVEVSSSSLDFSHTQVIWRAVTWTHVGGSTRENYELGA